MYQPTEKQQVIIKECAKNKIYLTMRFSNNRYYFIIESLSVPSANYISKNDGRVYKRCEVEKAFLEMYKKASNILLSIQKKH